MLVSSEAGAYSAGSGEPGLPPGKVRVEENSTGLVKVGRGSETQRTRREHCKRLKGGFWVCLDVGCRPEQRQLPSTPVVLEAGVRPVHLEFHGIIS